MVLTFNHETYEVKQLKLRPHLVRLNDFILYHGSLCRVVTIQRDCLGWRAHHFTQYTLVTRSGEIVPARDLFGFISVNRPLRLIKN